MVSPSTRKEIFISVIGMLQPFKSFQVTVNLLRDGGSPGSGDGEFIQPWDVAVDSNNFVYVPDSGNDRVQIFKNDGTFVIKWGTSGNGD